MEKIRYRLRDIFITILYSLILFAAGLAIVFYFISPETRQVLKETYWSSSKDNPVP